MVGLSDETDFLIDRLEAYEIHVSYEQYFHTNSRRYTTPKYTVFLDGRKVFSQTKLTRYALTEYLKSLLRAVESKED